MFFINFFLNFFKNQHTQKNVCVGVLNFFIL